MRDHVSQKHRDSDEKIRSRVGGGFGEMECVTWHHMASDHSRIKCLNLKQSEGSL